MKFAMIAAIPLLALSGVAVAQDAGNAAPASGHATHAGHAEGEQAPEPETAAEPGPASEQDARMQEVQCRTERVTGSRTRTNRICMTRAEWHELESGHADNVRTMQGRASGGAMCRSDAMGGC